MNSEENRELIIKKLGDLWGPGFFKSNACDFCDDVTSELADISIGDAWIKPFTEDWRGNNIIITRSKKAQEIIDFGVKSGELLLDPISTNQVYTSQKSNFEHRRIGLAYRLYLNSNRPIPTKRVKPQPPLNIFEKKIYSYKTRVRQKSLDVWLIQRNFQGLLIFKLLMFYDIFMLKFWQLIYRQYKKANFITKNHEE